LIVIFEYVEDVISILELPLLKEESAILAIIKQTILNTTPL